MKAPRNIEEREALLGINPFSYSVIIPVRRISTNTYIKDEEGIKTTLYKDLDNQQNVKIFKGDGNKEVVFGLSSKAKDLFLWLLFETKTGCDYIKFDSVKYMEDLGISSRTTITQAIAELCKVCFICKSPLAGYYWINPRFFFSGDRTIKYKANCKLK